MYFLSPSSTIPPRKKIENEIKEYLSTSFSLAHIPSSVVLIRNYFESELIAQLMADNCSVVVGALTSEKVDRRKVRKIN